MAKGLDGRLDSEIEAEHAAKQAMRYLLARAEEEGVLGNSSDSIVDNLREMIQEHQLLKSDRDLILGAIADVLSGSREDKKIARAYLKSRVSSTQNIEWERFKRYYKSTTVGSHYVVFALKEGTAEYTLILETFFFAFGLKTPQIEWQETKEGLEGSFPVSSLNLGQLLVDEMCKLPAMEKAYVQGPFRTFWSAMGKEGCRNV